MAWTTAPPWTLWPTRRAHSFRRSLMSSRLEFGQNEAQVDEGLPVKWKWCQARCVLKAETLAPLRHFRQELYDDLGLRQDSLFELADAVLTTPQRSTLVRLSLSTAFRRLWP